MAFGAQPDSPADPVDADCMAIRAFLLGFAHHLYRCKPVFHSSAISRAKALGDSRIFFFCHGKMGLPGHSLHTAACNTLYAPLNRGRLVFCHKPKPERMSPGYPIAPMLLGVDGWFIKVSLLKLPREFPLHFIDEIWSLVCFLVFYSATRTKILLRA